MNDAMVLELCRSVLITALKVAAPILGTGLVVGLLVSVFQAITSVHEQTMTLIPKMFAVIGVTLFLFPWITRVLVGYTAYLFQSLPNYAN